MNKYVATVRVGSANVKTVVFAESTLHARLILQYQFGMDSLVNSPSQTNEDVEGYLSLEEAKGLIKPLKPLTPQQARLNSLKKQKDNISNQIKSERSKQKIAKAQQQIFKATH